MLKNITKFFFYSLAFTPFIGIVLRGVYNYQVAAITIFGDVALIITIILSFRFGFKNLKKPKYLAIGFLFAIYFFIWSFFNGKIEEFGIMKMIFANQALLMLFIFIVIENTHFSESYIKKLVFFFKITIIASFIVSIIQVLVDQNFLMPEIIQEDNENFAKLSEYEVRNLSIFGYLDQNDIGLSFIPVLSLYVGYYLIQKTKRNILFISFIILGGLVCFLTNGRYLMVNFIIILSQFFLLKSFSLSKKIIYGGFAVILIGSVLYGLTYLEYDLNKFWNERIMSESGSSRILAFDLFAQLFPEHPLFGTGIRRPENLVNLLYGRSSQIHVGYLSALFEWGIFGGYLIFVYWYKIAKDLYYKAKVTLFYGAFFGFLTFLIANLVLVQYTILFYGLVYCFVFSKYYYNQSGFGDKHHYIQI